MTSSRWFIPLGAVAVHLCIGSVYAWSTFNRPIQELFPGSPWWFSPPYTTFTSALVLLGLSAAFGGPWVERRGPRAAATAAAVCFGTATTTLALLLCFRRWETGLGRPEGRPLQEHEGAAASAFQGGRNCPLAAADYVVSAARRCVWNFVSTAFACAIVASCSATSPMCFAETVVYISVSGRPV